MKIEIAAFALIMGLAASGSGAQATAVDTGRRVVTRNCSQCHAVGLEGSSPNAVAPIFRELNNRYPIEMLEEALAEGMLTGHRAMPQFRFTRREVNAIVAYLNSIQAKKIGDIRPGNGAPIVLRPL
jgi:mono/diheme cytochrome c family protein